MLSLIMHSLYIRGGHGHIALLSDGSCGGAIRVCTFRSEA